MNADFSIAHELSGKLIEGLYGYPDWSNNVIQKNESPVQDPRNLDENAKKLPVLPKISQGTFAPNQPNIGYIFEDDAPYLEAEGAADNNENPFSNPQFRLVSSQGCDLYIKVQSIPQDKEVAKIDFFDYFAYESEVKTSGILNKLCLKKINDTIGFGVFLKPTEQSIQNGRFLGIYAGDLKIERANCSNDDPVYCYHLFTVKGELKKLLPPNSSSMIVDARHSGNFTRYFNHSYNPNCFADLVLTPEGKYEVGFFASKTIHPGEQILIDYGMGYWKGKKIFYPFKLTPSFYRLNRAGAIEQKARVSRKVSFPTATVERGSQAEQALATVKPQFVYRTRSFLPLYETIADSKLPRNLSIRVVNSWNKALLFLDPKSRPIPNGTDLAILGGKYDLVSLKNTIFRDTWFYVRVIENADEPAALIIDGKGSKNFANKIAHSNFPNIARIICDITKVQDQLPEGTAKIQVVYRAIRKILPGEPITCDYGRLYLHFYPAVLTLDQKKCILQSDYSLRFEDEILQTSEIVGKT